MEFFNDYKIIFDNIKFIVNDKSWSDRGFNYIMINKKFFDINCLFKTQNAINMIFYNRYIEIINA